MRSQFIQSLLALLHKASSLLPWTALLLPDFLALDAMLLVQASKARHCNAFVWELSVKEDGSLLHSPTCPLFKRMRADQVLYVVIRKLADAPFRRLLLLWPQSLAAQVLHCVVGEAHDLRNHSVREELTRSRRRLLAAEATVKHGLA